MARTAEANSPAKAPSWSLDTWLPAVLATAALLLYVPSLQSGFVYDGRVEILNEGFITSLSNLPAVLSMQTLGMPLMLGDRPGQLLFMMGEAAVWGKHPWGYHLCSNLLHAANVALLFIVLRRLVAIEWPGAVAKNPGVVRMALSATTLIFAVHPLSVETVAAVNYSSDLLITAFTLLALIAAMHFRPDDGTTALPLAAGGVLCAQAAVTCKESGVACALILIVYWFLYRRQETKAPWLYFLGAALAGALIFLGARFYCAAPFPHQLPYLGGTFASVFVIQPRLWILMFIKLVWPTGLSADYTLSNADSISPGLALSVLLVVLAFQAWLTAKSRLGGLGVALFWLGLATVSNFTPLHRIVADRFYYLPLAGIAMQLTALLMMLRPGAFFWTATTALLAVIVPLTLLTLTREPVFANDFAMWSDTLAASPQSSLALNNLSESLMEKGRLDEAISLAQRAVISDPDFAAAHNNLGTALAQKGQLNAAMPEFQKAIDLEPAMAEAHNNLGAALLHFGRYQDSALQEMEALKIRPDFADAHCNLGSALALTGRLDEAIEQYQAALELDPRHPKAHRGLGVAYFQQQRNDAAITQFREWLAINPNNAEAHNDLGVVLLATDQLADAEAEFNETLRLAPGFQDAKNNLARAQAMEHSSAPPASK